MKGKDIMTPTLAVTPADPVWRAAEIMKCEDVGGVPVVESEATGRLVGFITDRDITVRCVARHHEPDCPVREHMSPQPLTVHPDADVGEIVQLMEAAEVRRIPVVDDDGTLVGIVSERDLETELATPDALPVRKRMDAASPHSPGPFEVVIN